MRMSGSMAEKKLQQAIAQSYYLGAGVDQKSWPKPDVHEVAFIGRSNVGKSSVIAALLNNKKLVQVSKTPGKTRILHFYVVPEIICLVDLPGYGYSKASKKENALIEKMLRHYFNESRRVTKIFILLDIRRLPSDQDLAIMQGFNTLHLPWSLIITKIDKVSKHIRKPQISRITSACPFQNEAPVVACSAHTKTGFNELWSHLKHLSISRQLEC